MFSRTPASILLASIALTAPAASQSRFATSVVDLVQGSGGGIFAPDNILGGPVGAGRFAGSLDVLSLGAGGYVTLGFDVTIVDGPGADLLVYENGFVVGDGTFAEVVQVEVSTDGIVFARVPSLYLGPPEPFHAFDSVPWGSYGQAPGGVPCVANVLTNTIDPFDPTVAGGDAIDLASLRTHPDVQSGAVDLDAIHFVRLVDVVAGIDTDSEDTTFQDTGGTGSADIDAVAVVQHAGNQLAGAPRVNLVRDDDGYLRLRIADPDGWSDLDLETLQMSLNLEPVTLGRLMPLFGVVRWTPNGIVLRSALPLDVLGMDGVLAVSVRDGSGAFSTDQVSLRW